MIVTFAEEYLRKLYEDGRCDDKKHRYQPDIVRRYQKAINFLKGASSVETLWRIHSLNYEVLSGDKAGRSSIRVNNQYRVEFTIDLNEKDTILTVCNVVELSNHYK
ncbi:MAG: type II toxin-antitoxin system RelE/ParE family toxin [Muribaculaceae bacterium]|nr:type II toxin-antitoxin system RelE/ParE family toxin [Muribaculaceae bacterium]